MPSWRLIVMLTGKSISGDLACKILQVPDHHVQSNEYHWNQGHIVTRLSKRYSGPQLFL
ncbi:MAG: hypothetical protein ACYTE0_11790 [Planctomycetota bacterium]